jgi:hypothetical protein
MLPEGVAEVNRQRRRSDEPWHDLPRYGNTRFLKNAPISKRMFMVTREGLRDERLERPAVAAAREEASVVQAIGG